MACYGYVRVSTADQDCTLQEQALRAAGCEIIRAEKASATRREGRTELALLLEFLRPGDTMVVTRVDRLARSIKDLQDIIYLLQERGVTLRATEQPINTQSAAGKAFLDMLGVFAEFETNLRRERQLEGIAAAKARGVYRGRKPSIDPVEVQRLYAEERLGAAAIARRLGIGRAAPSGRSRRRSGMTDSDYASLQQHYGGQYIARRAGEVVASSATYEGLSDLLDALEGGSMDVIIEYVEPAESVRAY